MIYLKTNSFYFNKEIRITKSYWEKLIKFKHPSMKNNEKKVLKVIEKPDEIRQSKFDKDIYLYYSRFKLNHLCVVIKHLNDDGFIVTAYFAKKIKEGDLIWRK